MCHLCIHGEVNLCFEKKVLFTNKKPSLGNYAKIKLVTKMFDVEKLGLLGGC